MSLLHPEFSFVLLVAMNSQTRRLVDAAFNEAFKRGAREYFLRESSWVPRSYRPVIPPVGRVVTSAEDFIPAVLRGFAASPSTPAGQTLLIEAAQDSVGITPYRPSLRQVELFQIDFAEGSASTTTKTESQL